MDIRRLRYFVAVAEELHFGRAALRLNVVQPAISQQVRLLEEELGIQLLDRSSRRVVLTDPGHVLLQEARKALRQLDFARQAVIDATQGLIGKLVVGFVDNAIWSVLPALLRSFRLAYPLVELDLRQMNRTSQVAALKAGELDLGILPSPVTDDAVLTASLTSGPLHVALPRGHKLCAEASVPVASLAEERFLSFPSASDTRRIDEMILAICEEAGFTPILGQAVQQMHTSLGLVSAGFGVAVVPPWMKSVGVDAVEYRPLTPSLTYELLLVTMAGPPRPIVTSFLATASRMSASSGT